MAKSRAQKKAERRRRAEREQQRKAEARKKAAGSEEPEELEELEEPTDDPASLAEAAEAGEPASPAPSRADVGKPEGEELTRRERRRQEKERQKRAKESAERRKGREPETERRRGPVVGFFGQVWAELRRVQWPDRDALIQASTVTLIFVFVAAAYLGALDTVFNFLIQRIL